MASEYTANTGIEKPGSGEQSGTWGTTTNNNFDIIDKASMGVAEISISGNTTLTTTDGTISQANASGSNGGFRAFIFTGSLSSAATITISPSDQEKVLLIKNSTSGGYSLTIRQGDGAAGGSAGDGEVSVENGVSAWVFTTGSGTNSKVHILNVGSSSIADDAITTAKIADDAITSALIADDAVVTASIADNAITLALMADDSVGASELVDNSVGASALNISGNGTAGQVIASDGDGSFSYSTLSTGFVSGMLMPYAGTSAPSGWLLCYGQAISRSTYSTLFSAISDTYGVGDGSSTFNLPDLRGRVVAGQDDMGGVSANNLTNQTGGLNGDTLGATGGAETHLNTSAQSGLPAHSHSATTTFTTVFGSNGSSGVLTDSNRQTSTGTASTTIANASTQDASQAHNNVQPTIILNYIIKT